MPNVKGDDCRVWAYMNAACAKAGIPTYEDHAC